MTSWNFQDLTGQTFGRLTVIKRVENDKHDKARWLCRCSCERKTEVIVNGNALKRGRTKSCGCLNVERLVKRNTTHGKSDSPTHSTWVHIKDRCTNPNSKRYKDYGGRGITMYPAWVDDFQAFYDYVSKLPHFGEKGYSLDRINNNGNYEPDNLRFADNKTQARNRRNNILVEYQGREMCLAEAAELSGIGYQTLVFRYKHGKRGEDLFRKVVK